MTTDHHTGGCQCGRVRYEVDLSLDAPITCNCSRCERLGAVLAFAPATAFTLLKGEDAMTEFRFNSGTIQHLFCATCGIQSFSRATAPDGTAGVAINVNCLDGVDPRALSPTHFDGASR